AGDRRDARWQSLQRGGPRRDRRLARARGFRGEDCTDRQARHRGAPGERRLDHAGPVRPSDLPGRVLRSDQLPGELEATVASCRSMKAEPILTRRALVLSPLLISLANTSL